MFACIIWISPKHIPAMIRIDHICSSFSPLRQTQKWNKKQTKNKNNNAPIDIGHGWNDIADKIRTIRKTVQLKCLFEHPQVFFCVLHFQIASSAHSSFDARTLLCMCVCVVCILENRCQNVQVHRFSSENKTSTTKYSQYKKHQHVDNDGTTIWARCWARREDSI